MAEIRSSLREVLWNDRQRRPRAPWRLALAFLVAIPFLVGGVVVVVGVVVLLRFAFGDVFVPIDDGTVLVLLATVGQNAALTFAAVVAAVVVDRRLLSDLGLDLGRNWALECVVGLAIGGGLMTGVFAVELLAGWIAITGTLFDGPVPVAPFLLYAAAFLAASVGEEVVFRGYVLTNVAEGLDGFGPIGTRGATATGVAVTSLFFGITHLGNPSATLLSSAIITLAGALLGLAYVTTESLAVPIGFHAAWNLAQGSVFGFPVSGLGDAPSLVVLDQAGPELLTGGPFGPEAGGVGFAAFLAGIACVLAWARYAHDRLGIGPGLTTPALRWEEGADAEG